MDQGFGAEDAVNGSRHDAASIACALTGGIKTAQRGLTFCIAHDPDRGGAAGLGAGEHRIGIGKALHAVVEIQDALLQIVGDPLGSTSWRSHQWTPGR